MLFLDSGTIQRLFNVLESFTKCYFFLFIFLRLEGTVF